MITDPFAKKSLGQHWLKDEAILKDIASSAQLTPQDTVLEIGPGPGGLTAVLCQMAKEVVAVEFDARLAAALPQRVPAKNLRVINQDILRLDFSQLPAGYKIAANIPYYLTSNLIRVMSETPNPATVAVLLVQKEVAERVAAAPGNMSILSVTAQYYWRVVLGRVVEAALFTPPPKVDSQVLILTRHTDDDFADVDTKQLFRLVKAGFSGRRKTLLNSLSAGLHLSREEVVEFCRSAQIDHSRRAQTLSLDEWHSLYRAYSKS